MLARADHSPVKKKKKGHSPVKNNKKTQKSWSGKLEKGFVINRCCTKLKTDKNPHRRRLSVISEMSEKQWKRCLPKLCALIW